MAKLETYKKVKKVEADVAIIGAGLSGVVVALTCASNGLKTILIEKYGFPGGLITTSLAYPLRVLNVQRNFSELFMAENSDTIEFPIFSTVVKYLLKNEAIPQELLPDPLKISESIIPIDFEKFKFTLLEVLLDFKVDLLFHASFVKARLRAGNVNSILVLGKEGLIEVVARYFVDATGNCVIFSSIDEIRKVKPTVRYSFVLSGCDFSEKDERIICESVNFDSNNGSYHACVIEMDEEKLAAYELLQKGYCVVFGLSANEFDIDDVISISEAEKSLQLKVYQVVEYLRQFKPFERARISVLPAQAYFTEGYRLNGLYTLSYADVVNGRRFDDEVAVIKISIVGENIFPCLLSPDKKFDALAVSFPLSCFLTDIENLIAVGRSANVSEELKFILYSFPFAMKTSESIGKVISLAFKNGLKLTDFGKKVKV